MPFYQQIIDLQHRNKIFLNLNKDLFMKKVLRPIGLILLSGTLCSTGQVFATDVKSEAVANIAQQKKQVTGTVIDAFGPVAG